jgi:hypothetical protein
MKMGDNTKRIAGKAFQDLTATLDVGSEVSNEEILVRLGAVIGLTALSIERFRHVDRNATLKMIQRVAHQTIKQIEENPKREG